MKAMVLSLQVILKSEPVHPFGLAVYGEHIFWTDWVRRAVQRANKYVGSDMKLLRVDIPQQPMGIIAVANDTNSCEWGRCCQPCCPAYCASARTHTHHPTLFSSASLNTPVHAFVVLPTQNHTFSHNLIIHTEPRFCLHHPVYARAQTHSHTEPGGLSVLHTDPKLSWASHTGPGAPITTHMTSTPCRLESLKACLEFHIIPPERIHVLQLRAPTNACHLDVHRCATAHRYPEAQ